jgi:hypothetical protein
MTPLELDLLSEAWTAVAGEPSPPPLDIDGPTMVLPANHPVAATAVACVGTALLATRTQGVRLDRGHVAAAVRSERSFTVDGRPMGAGFAPLSRLWRTADGSVRTHGNYPWHREALLRAVAASTDDEVADAMAELTAVDVEEAVVAAGGVAGAVRTVSEWLAHPQGAAVASEPLVGLEFLGDSPPRTDRGRSPRVLDLTRVIAGPVCTRLLGALGADVLRLDPPHRPDLPEGQPADTLLGKRSAVLDLRVPTGAARLNDLLANADVVVTGYRPGALDRFGLEPHALAEQHPGLVVVVLNAWGHTGPWASRRGFDSVVQAPSGIAAGESLSDGTPGALPCQLLDHGTGYLAAAAVLDGLRRQRKSGGTVLRRLSLARTAAWLTSRPGHSQSITDEADDARYVVDVGGGVRAVSPPGTLDGHPVMWPTPPALAGHAEVRWRS